MSLNKYRMSSLADKHAEEVKEVIEAVEETEEEVKEVKKRRLSK